MIITINTELLQPLQKTFSKFFGLQVEAIETDRTGELQVELPLSWTSNHWFDFGLQAGMDFQFKSTLVLND